MTVRTDETRRARRMRRLSGTAAFGLPLAGLVAMMTGASAPSPFYPVLQRDLDFSSATLTVIFSIYAIALLGTLLVTGALSDHVGRRPVLSVGFVVLATSMLVFWHADSVGTLIGARILQGIATGLLMAALSAAVVDLEPESRPGWAPLVNAVAPLSGLAVGSLAAGVVLDASSAPLVVVFGALTAVYLLLAFLVWALPETAPRHTGILQSLRPRVGVPVPARATFARSVPALVAGWATGGLYLSLGAPLVARELGGTDHVEQALAVTTLTGVGSLACLLARDRTPRQITLFGTTALAVGTALSLVALASGSLFAFYGAVVVAGVGFGTAFLGIMRSITPTVGPDQRGELFAAVFVVSYLAFGVPAVLAGLAVPAFGLADTTYVFGAVVALLSAVAALWRRYGATD